MRDQFRPGKTIKEWIEGGVKWQLKDYIESPQVKKLVEDGLVMHAHIVVVIGSRHILLWNMEDGKLVENPILVGVKLAIKVPKKLLEKPISGIKLAKKALKKVEISQRKCGICGKPGHNRTTCPTRKH